MSLLATEQLECGLAEDAARAFRRTLEAMEAANGPTHAGTLRAVVRLGNAVFAMGRLQEAAFSGVGGGGSAADARMACEHRGAGGFAHCGDDKRSMPM